MNRLRGQSGAAAVEFGLLLPLLVMLAFGIIESSTAYNRSQGMQAGVREAARYAASGDISDADVEGRLEAVLQTDDGGAGFPAPGGPLDTLDSDIEVTVEYFADKSDFDNDIVSATGDCTTAYAVRVTGSITSSGDRQQDYGLVFPLIGTFPLDHSSEALFRCLG